MVTMLLVLSKLSSPQQLWNMVYTLREAPDVETLQYPLDEDLCDVKQFLKIAFQNTESVLDIFSGQETKSYSQFTSIARHLISSKWTLCAQSIEAVYPGKYTKHWSLLCVWLMWLAVIKWRITLSKAVVLQLHAVRPKLKCKVIVIAVLETIWV